MANVESEQEKKVAARMAARERAQQALASSANLNHNLSEMRERNDKALSKTDPRTRDRERSRMSKREAAQHAKLEKSYRRSKERAEARAERLSFSENITHQYKQKHKHKHKHKNKGHSGNRPLTAEEHRSLGKLPAQRKRFVGAAHKHDHVEEKSQNKTIDDGNAHLNKHKHEYDNEKKILPSVSLTTNEHSSWIAFVDEHTAYTVYFNESTHETSWNPPPDDIGYRWLDVKNGDEPPAEAKLKIDAMSDPEGLGAEWMASTYREPSILRALNFRRQMLYRGGGAPISIPMDYLGEMGIGTLLYFKFLSHIIFTFAIMSIIVLPVLFAVQIESSSVTEAESFVYRLTGRSSTSVDECLRSQVGSFVSETIILVSHARHRILTATHTLLPHTCFIGLIYSLHAGNARTLHLQAKRIKSVDTGRNQSFGYAVLFSIGVLYRLYLYNRLCNFNNYFYAVGKNLDC